MDSSVCGSDNLPPDTENANLNEATPAVIPAPASDLPKETSGADCDDAISSTTPDKFVEDLEHDSLINLPKPSMSSETDADFFSSELSISDVPTEKITENVEDIVQDLENLLGESNDSYRFSRESFDNSKLPDSYDEVNSSNVNDLFAIEPTNLDEPPFDCNILPDINVPPSNNIECEPKETEINKASELAVTESIEEISIVPDLDVELNEIVTEPVMMAISDTPEEVSAIVNLVESQTESELPSNDVISESEVINQSNTNFNEDQINVEVIQKSVLEPEIGPIENIIDTDISTSNVAPEDTDSYTNPDVNEICQSSEVEQNVDEIAIDTVQNTTELLEELINDSNTVENVIESSSNVNVLKEAEEKCSIIQEECFENVQEPLADKPNEEINIVSELPEIVTGNDSSEPILAETAEDVEAEAPSQTLIEHSAQEEQITEATQETNGVLQTIVADEAITTTNNEVSPDEPPKVEPEIPESLPILINEQIVTPTSSIEIDEQNLTNRNSTELIQPLTVEVENPDCTERDLTEISTQEQTPEKDISSKEEKKLEDLQPESEIKQPVLTDTDSQTNRAPLKMTITKHKSDNIHSILKIYDPNDIDSNPVQHIPKLIIKSTPTSTTSDDPEQTEAIPKITIKSVLAPTETQHSPRLTIKPIKEVSDKQSSPKTTKPSTSGTGSPRITIKPVVKPESLSPLKLTLKPYPKLEAVPSSPKLNIKPIVKPLEESETHHSPKITIKPIVKPPEENENYSEEKHSPRITIKPIIKPPEELSKEAAHSCADDRPSPRITIKPIIKPPEEVQNYSEEKHSPKITIKPIIKPPEEEQEKHSPRITIKPIVKPPEEVVIDEPQEEKHSPRITIKPIIKPNEEEQISNYPEERPSPKVTIKPIKKPEEEIEADDRQNLRITIKPIKQADDSVKEEIPTYSEERYSPRITIKPVIKPPEETVKEEGAAEEKPTPRITIKPVIKPPDEETIKEEVLIHSEEKHSPRITIKPIIKPPDEEPTKEELQVYSEEKHSPRITIKPIIKPSEEEPTKEEVLIHSEEKHSPRITIKPIIKPPDEEPTKEELQVYSEDKHSPRITIKPIIKPTEEEPTKEEVLIHSEEKHSPRITIKPVIKPPGEEPTKEELQIYSEEKHSPRITIKPIIKPSEEEPTKEEVLIHSEEKHSPRITIKPIIKPSEEEPTKEEVLIHSEEKHSPRITIKPIIKPPDEEPTKEELQVYSEERHSPRITIKPVIKPSEIETETSSSHSPRITIKPVMKPHEDSKQMDEMSVTPVQPFKLNIKPIMKPMESNITPKVTIKPVPKPIEPEDEPIELIDFEDQIKQERIVLKIAKNTKKDKESEKLKKIKLKLSKERGLAHIIPQSLKRSASDEAERELKHFKSDLPSDLTISLVSNTASTTNIPDVTITRIDTDTKPEETIAKQKQEQISSFFSREEIPDPLADIPIFEITLQTATGMSSAPPRPAPAIPAIAAVTPPAPRKRGRPRKVPLEVREEFKDPKEEEAAPPVVVEESTRPKRSCRGASVKATLGIKPRKPRAPSTRGRGGKRTVSTRAPAAKKPKERKSSAGKLKLSMAITDQLQFKDFDTKNAEFKQVPLPAELGNREVVIYEEETRMSAENSSRAQTPAKQVLTSAEGIEESQSSIQSNTTTESGEKKARKGPRLEVHQEPEGEVISADKLAEYSWGGGGPYMLQEQVAQFLGIKSFKRKYPGIQRRPVDMQERDFIRESCLASEAMCDMGLTAVRSEDILDIMYTDFQHKYEEYCKHQRDRQAKDVSNKQKALSLAASQEKNKLDIVEQAVQSAFQWNANFNKARREQRRACMDLQTFTVHFPKGKMKQVNKQPIGNYPLALVPGQFTDYYKKYNALELGNLPLNSIGCKTISISSVNQDTEESQSDGSGSDSDSSSSDSDSSDSSSGAEDCKMCTPTPHAAKKMLVH